MSDGGGRLVFLSTWNEKFDSVLLLAAQYYWKTPPQGVVFVESIEAFNALPREVTGDHVVLFAGDRNAELAGIRDFEPTGRDTWSIGVGSVTAMRRVTRDESGLREPRP